MWKMDYFRFATFIITYLWLNGTPGTEALQCYNCRGITNYDPNECFNPVPGKTVLQECQKGDVCEKRVTMVDRLQDVIDRGCSSNCAGRQFVWTDEFQVYCCNNQDYCNGSVGKHSSVRMAYLWTALILTSYLILNLIFWWTKVLWWVESTLFGSDSCGIGFVWSWNWEVALQQCHRKF